MEFTISNAPCNQSEGDQSGHSSEESIPYRPMQEREQNEKVSRHFRGPSGFVADLDINTDTITRRSIATQTTPHVVEIMEDDVSDPEFPAYLLYINKWSSGDKAKTLLHMLDAC